MTHLNPVRHHLNLTVRGGVFVHKILIRDGEVVGVEAESGGEVFQIEAGRVVLSARAIRSPHLLMLSGIGPEDQLRQFGIPVVLSSPWRGSEHIGITSSAQMTFKVKDGICSSAPATAVHLLHFAFCRRIKRRQRHAPEEQPGRRRTGGAVSRCSNQRT